MNENDKNSDKSVQAYNIIDVDDRDDFDFEDLDDNKLLNIVPGDIFVKESINSNNRLKNSHIAIVAYVPNDSYNCSKTDLSKKILLIEAEYTGQIQSVIKCITLYDYQNNLVKSDFYGITISRELNCKAWAIRRLMY